MGLRVCQRKIAFQFDLVPGDGDRDLSGLGHPDALLSELGVDGIGE